MPRADFALITVDHEGTVFLYFIMRKL